MAKPILRRIGDQFQSPKLGLVTIYDIESAHTIIVVDAKDRYFRVSGLPVVRSVQS